MEPKILDVTCGGRSIWFDKHNPYAVYCDNRRESFEMESAGKGRRQTKHVEVSPDVLCDFTDLPFDDNSFYLVVFDPPHLTKIGETAWMKKQYGKLYDGWEKMIHDGFWECMRVLKPNGVLVFKWSETDIPAKKVWAAIGKEPLFGHRSGKKSNTHWACFMKIEGET